MSAERPGWVTRLSEALAEPSRLDRVVAIRPGVGARAAGVLVLIGEGASGPEVLFVERPATMRTHPGQVAFPGGAADAGDVDLADTALREAEEETGVDRSGIEVLGLLPPAHVDVSGFDVTAVLAWWREPGPVRVVDPREAASVPVLPVAELVDPANRGQVRHPSGYTGPAFELRGLLIWGLTAHLLDGVLELAGWQQPWDHSRLMTIPAVHLSGRTRRTTGGHDAH